MYSENRSIVTKRQTTSSSCRLWVDGGWTRGGKHRTKKTKMFNTDPRHICMVWHALRIWFEMFQTLLEINRSIAAWCVRMVSFLGYWDLAALCSLGGLGRMGEKLWAAGGRETQNCTSVGSSIRVCVTNYYTRPLTTMRSLSDLRINNFLIIMLQSGADGIAFPFEAVWMSSRVHVN